MNCSKPASRWSGRSVASPAVRGTDRGRSTSTYCCWIALEYASERLTLPHPEVTSRRFVLVPLLELDPGLTLPDGTSLAEALDALGGEGQEVRRAGDPLV